MSALLIMLAQVVTAEEAPLPLVLTLTARPSQSGCGDMGGRDVVVCGQRSSRYRLPFPREREPGVVEHPSGEAPSALASIRPSGRCGIFAGERRCSKAEAAEYGYGEGRDPITVLSTLGRKLVSPDSEP